MNACMIRFNLNRLLVVRKERERRRITWREVADATGISASVLSNLASHRGGHTTNTRFVEALCRYFECSFDELMSLDPPLDEAVGPNVEGLYPERGAHRAAERDAPRGPLRRADPGPPTDPQGDD